MAPGYSLTLTIENSKTDVNETTGHEEFSSIKLNALVSTCVNVRELIPVREAII